MGENRHGDLAWLADASGAVTDTRIYDPYGAVAGATGSTDPAVGYQGDYTDAASGFVWMGARWYDPTAAIFVSRDDVFGELRTPVGLNRYTYAAGDPLEFFDPDGRWGLSTIWGAASSLWSGFTSYVVQPVFRAVGTAARAVGSAARSVGQAAATVSRAFVGAGKRAVAQTVRVAQKIGGTTREIASKIAGGVKAGARSFGGGVAAGASAFASAVATAAKATYRCFDGIHATCTTIAGGIAAAAAVGIACGATGGLGCAIAAGAAGGAVTDALGCPEGRSLTRCALGGAILGGVAGGVLYKGASVLRSMLGRGSRVGAQSGVRRIGGGLGDDLGAPARGTPQTTLYRAVSKAELDDVAANGFRASERSMSGKFFAETPEHAAEWGRRLIYGKEGIPFHVVETRVPTSFADRLMRWDKLDGIGPARYVDDFLLDELNRLRSPIVDLPAIPRG